MAAKAKRRVSAATVARLRELRRKHGLGEFAAGDPFRGKRRGKKAARRSSGRLANYARAIGQKLGF